MRFTSRCSIRPVNWLVPAVTLALIGCENGVDPELEARTFLSTAIASDPTAGPATGAGGAVLSGTGAEDFTYVSLPPGSIQNAEWVTIRNRRTGRVVEAPMAEGGFDPTAVAASAGDTLDLDIRVSYLAEPLPYALIVPPRRPPVVVRTDPPPRKRDVPLNASLLIVFSEPMDAGILTAGAVRLELGQTLVAGQLEWADAAHLTAAFVPDAPLAPETSYHLVITEQSRDLDGDPLQATVVVEFGSGPGGLIAFSSAQGGTPSISVLNLDDYGVTKLAPGSSPVWSPDGTQIAFFSGTAIHVMNADGSGLRQLASGGTCPAWSPDGTRIALRWGSGVYLADTDVSGDGDSTALSELAPWSSCPRWSPDGTRVAFSAKDTTWGIYVVNADGSNLARIRDGSGPVWSPDGATIAFCHTGGAGATYYWESWLMNPDGSSARPLTRWQCGMSWSPDGTRLLEYYNGIYVFGTDGSAAIRLSRSYANGDGVPTWSPDGRFIAFASNRDQRLETDYDLYIIGVDGSGLTRLTTNAKVSRGAPAWTRSPSAVAQREP
jgi:Tol biopolymer transport system component